MPSNGDHFDFVVVGGGTAGNVVAGRLAENPKAKILVIEAGIGKPEDVAQITTPGKAMTLRGSEYDWAYKTTMVKRDDYERIEKPNTRGKALGGSSSLNYFTWVPGSKGTFDLWEAYGGKDWTWDPLLPYLRKSATYHDDPKMYDTGLQKLGAGGPLHISHAELLPETEAFRKAIQSAWKSTGQPDTENIYDGNMIGLTHCVDTIYKGVRSNSVVFLRGKPNITILSETHSKKLVVDAASKKVTGVTVIGKDGKDQTFYADREVIVAQGVFESPKLLMLSGIGPKDQLKQHGISVVVDSPNVGQNLFDHPAVPFVLRVKDGYGLDDFLHPARPHVQATQQTYDQSHTGPLSSGDLEMVGFPRIDSYLEKVPAYVEAKKKNGGVDPFCGQGQPHFELDFVSAFGSAFQWHYPVPKQGNYTSVVVDLVRPVSKPGEVTLNSADPLAQPNINLNFFENDLDIIAMREGIRFSYDMLTKGDGFKDIVVAEYPWEMPLDDDKAMHHAVLDRCQTAFHPCGTNRLSKDIQQGVVDKELRVHGVSGLRVIDASIIPEIPDCRIQNSVYAVGEKGADLIKAAHRDLY
ncbi:glucose-methanol-choline (gmc) oxidoreductase [Sporothrix schenckii 1099-18]|uniref:Glucose-methanol-choline (Gmc) oxidoreductase n=1 Tax=Sporothrix schenckii 1099-18 TaxID=1397361 RepID=A0A0F2MKC3_SPOSC|nr:glucose-methanol-choline (gmc) oxidoreductase [Sporothrix schenckii 1099-18]KJR90062.1 glucose-methanol-choline (gmc) oxidoreductase [Sporothrix schenckii 1099-18]